MTICLIILKWNSGLTNLSRAFLRIKGARAMRAQTIIPVQVARAAPHTPKPKTPRNRNSSRPLKTDINILRAMLPRINPQMRRKLSMANIMVVRGEQRA